VILITDEDSLGETEVVWLIELVGEWLIDVVGVSDVEKEVAVHGVVVAVTDEDAVYVGEGVAVRVGVVDG